MSVGTLVTIVLLMAVLILGIFLVRKIFTGASGAIDMTNEQLRSEIQKLFAEEKKLVIFPTSRSIEIKHEEKDAIGIGIKNLATSGTGTNEFSYQVAATESGNCPANVDSDAWIIVGQSESDIPLPVGEFYSTKIIFQIPLGTPLCTTRFRADVKIDGTSYKSESFDVSVKG